MKNAILDHDFFSNCCLHTCLHCAGITRYQLQWTEEDAEMVRRLVAATEKDSERYRLMAEKEAELFPEDPDGRAEYTVNRTNYAEQQERLRSVRVMQEIQAVWDTEEDYGPGDEWYGDRYLEYLKALYTLPTDELPDMMPSIGLRGRKLGYLNTQYYNGLCLRDDSDLPLLRRSDCSQMFFDRLTAEDMSVPFDAHSLWDALLLLLSAQWIWKPTMHMIAPKDDKGRLFLPRLTVRGDKAIATFCSVGPQTNKEHDMRPLYKNGILLQRCGDSFEILGGYSVYCGEGYNFEISVEAPDEIPPMHSFTTEELAQIEEALRRKAQAWDDEDGWGIPF